MLSALRNKKLLLVPIKALHLLALLLIGNNSLAQQEIPLYDSVLVLPTGYKEKIDESGNISGDFSPTLTLYLPDKKKAKGIGVIICPGGGYSSLVIGMEGYAIAQYLKKEGIAAFVLKYRLPKADTYGHEDLIPLSDAQQAVKKLRDNASEWNIDTNRIGMMGFSAGGGHLVAMAGTHFNNILIPNPNNVSIRPDFIILLYPALSMTDSLGHARSRLKLLGNNPSKELILLYSNEFQVTEQSSPTLLLHSSDDQVVKTGNCLLFYEALLDHRVPAEIHIFPYGGHGGFVLTIPKDQWIRLCVKWMNFILKKK